MVMLIGTEKFYRIDDLSDHRRFLRALWHILDEGDAIIFSTYGSTRTIHEFFITHQLTPDDTLKCERNRLSLYADEYPKASAYILPATQKLLDELADICSSDPTELCDHIFVRGPRGGILTFHDAFKSDPLYISFLVEEARIISFSHALGTSYIVEDNKFVT